MLPKGWILQTSVDSQLLFLVYLSPSLKLPHKKQALSAPPPIIPAHMGVVDIHFVIFIVCSMTPTVYILACKKGCSSAVGYLLCFQKIPFSPWQPLQLKGDGVVCQRKHLCLKPWRLPQRTDEAASCWEKAGGGGIDSSLAQQLLPEDTATFLLCTASLQKCLKLDDIVVSNGDSPFNFAVGSGIRLLASV